MMRKKCFFIINISRPNFSIELSQDLYQMNDEDDCKTTSKEFLTMRKSVFISTC